MGEGKCCLSVVTSHRMAATSLTIPLIRPACLLAWLLGGVSVNKHKWRQGGESLPSAMAGETFSGCEARPLRWCLGILHITEVSKTEFVQVMSCVHTLHLGAPRWPVSNKGHPHQSVWLWCDGASRGFSVFPTKWMCFLKRDTVGTEWGMLSSPPLLNNKHQGLTLTGSTVIIRNTLANFWTIWNTNDQVFLYVFKDVCRGSSWSKAAI